MFRLEWNSEGVTDDTCHEEEHETAHVKWGKCEEIQQQYKTFSHSRSHFYFFVSASSTTKVMEKCATFFLGTGRVANSISSATESLDGYTIRSVKHSMQHARLTVTVPARRHHCTLVNTKLYCLVTVIQECE